MFEEEKAFWEIISDNFPNSKWEKRIESLKCRFGRNVKRASTIWESKVVTINKKKIEKTQVTKWQKPVEIQLYLC